MYINHKKLKFYYWLTRVSPVMFNLDLKIIQRYNFFNLAEKSLKFPLNFWFDYVSIFCNLRLILKSDLDRYTQLALEGSFEKFFPTMLSEFFKYFPMFNVPFGDPEILLFDLWCELPSCIDELYNIILEKNWSPHISRTISNLTLTDLIFSHDDEYSQDVFDYVLLTSSDYKNSLDIFLANSDENSRTFIKGLLEEVNEELYSSLSLPIVLISLKLC